MNQVFLKQDIRGQNSVMGIECLKIRCTHWGMTWMNESLGNETGKPKRIDRFSLDAAKMRNEVRYTTWYTRWGVIFWATS